MLDHCMLSWIGINVNVKTYHCKNGMEMNLCTEPNKVNKVRFNSNKENGIQSDIKWNSQSTNKINKKSRNVSKTLGNMLKVDFVCIDNKEMSYAKGHDAEKYNQYIDKKSAA